MTEKDQACLKLYTERGEELVTVFLPHDWRESGARDYSGRVTRTGVAHECRAFHPGHTEPFVVVPVGGIGSGAPFILTRTKLLAPDVVRLDKFRVTVGGGEG